MDLLAYALVFASAGSAVMLAGSILARSADAIAEHTGIGRVWIGAVLLAAATSLPELAVDVSAVRMRAADLAAGDLFGSSMANMLVLAVLDLAFPRKRLLRQATLDHALSASFAIALNAGAALLVLVRFDASVLGVSSGSVALAAAYLAGTRAVYLHVQRNGPSVGGPRPAASPLALRAAIVRFCAGTGIVLVGGPALAWAGRGIAEVSGLGTTFVGTWLVGFTTSLPELVSSLAAVRMGAFDLAVGNLFGSNAFNMLIFVALDLAEPRQAIFTLVDPAHAVTGLFAVLLMSLGIAAIVYRAERRFAMLEPDSLLMIAVYLLALGMLYTRTVAG